MSVVASLSQICKLPLIDGVGAEATKTVAFAVAVHPPLPVAVTEYIPNAFTLIDAPVSPVDHWYETPPLAVIVVLLPSHTVVLPVIETSGAEYCATVNDALDVQPFAPVAITEYVQLLQIPVHCFRFLPLLENNHSDLVSHPLAVLI